MASPIVPSTQRLTLHPAARPQRLSLGLPRDLSYRSWQQIGQQLGSIADSSAWWLGDWLIYGETRYPQRYHRAIQETALDYQTLKNYAWVARRFVASRRRARLSFQHHAEVCALPPTEQDHWLDQATEFSWSRNELRRRLRNRALEQAGVDVTKQVVLHIPRQQRETWQEAAQTANTSLGEWITDALTRAAQAALDDAPDQR